MYMYACATNDTQGLHGGKRGAIWNACPGETTTESNVCDDPVYLLSLIS